jgi:SAM-dependent methyltransferase
MGGWRQRLSAAVRRASGARPDRPTRAASQISPRAEPKPGAPIWLVEEFTHTRVRGWVAVRPSREPVKVTLFLNSLPVMATWLTGPDARPAGPDRQRRSSGEVRMFELRIRDVWAFARLSARLSVRIEQRPLPIFGHGTYRRPARNGKRSVGELRSLLENGHVFSSMGRLQLSKTHDTEWQGRVMDLYAQVRALVRAEFGHECFLAYGTLLGAVREGGYIGHDFDFDVAYLSDHTDPAEAARELQQIALMLIERGYDVDTKQTALHIHHPEHHGTRIDLFHLYFDDADELCFPFGVAGTTKFRRAQWTGIREIDFSDASAAIPASATEFVEHIYGSSWRHPKPGWSWGRELTQCAPEGRLPRALQQAAYWSNFYKHHHYVEPSTFCTYIAKRSDTPEMIFDIGCGDGRDARAFAASGSHVIGLDRSQVGVEAAEEQALADGLADRAQFVVCDVADAVALRTVVTEAIAKHGDSPVMFYLRFFLHSIPDDVQESLLGVIAESARTGDLFAAEFRTVEDRDRRKTHAGHFRRYQSGAEFRLLLEDSYGFNVLDEEEGTGLSVYSGEDPYLYRVVARRADSTT